MTRILITGATGFIGSHLVKYLSKDYEVIALGRTIKNRVSLWQTLLSAHGVVLGDLTNFDWVLKTLNHLDVNIIYHLAAEAIVKRAQREPRTSIMNNILATLNILEASRQLGIEKIIIQSTDKVYTEPILIKPPSDYPIEPYATSKSCSDLIGLTYMDTYGMNIAIVRMCNVYGYDLSPRIIPNTIRQCIRFKKDPEKYKPPVIYKNIRGIRQYIYIKDACDALSYFINSKLTGIFNIGTQDIFSQEEIVRMICDKFNIQPREEILTSPLREIPEQKPLKTNIPWSPKYSIDKGLDETIKEFEKYYGIEWR